MKTISSFAVAAVLTVGLVASASAQSFAPTIPTPANPTPANPVATDGSSLLSLRTGRSIAVPAQAGAFYGSTARY